MKPYIAWSFVLILFLTMSGCMSHTNYSDPVTLYYPRLEYTVGKEDSVIASELREADGLTRAEWVTSYLNGPESSELGNPFPAGTELIDLQQEEDTVYLILSDAFAALSGIDLTIACTCLARTVLQETDAVRVSIRAEKELLDGSTEILIEGTAAYIDYGAQNSETTQP